MKLLCSISAIVLSMLFSRGAYSWITSRQFGRTKTSVRDSNYAESTPVRLLGGYERLLSRIAPNTTFVSLSHGAAYILNEAFSHSNMLEAVAKAIKRHPMLRAHISTAADSQKYFFYCSGSFEDLASKVLQTERTTESSFDNHVTAAFESALNAVEFVPCEPLWRMKNIISLCGTKSAWVFTLNHALDDQQSANILASDLLKYLSVADKLGEAVQPLPFPPSVEAAVAPEMPDLNTAMWAMFQLGNSLSRPLVVPFHVLQLRREEPALWKKYANPMTRRTFTRFLTVPSATLEGLRQNCHIEGVTVTNVLSAVVAVLTAAAMHGLFIGEDTSDDDTENFIARSPVGKRRLDTLTDLNLRFLLSVGLRGYGKASSFSSDENGAVLSGKNDWTGGTVACAAGAVDFILTVSAKTLRSSLPLPLSPSLSSEGDQAASNYNQDLWTVAKVVKGNAARIIEVNNYVPESVRLFGFGMDLEYVDILQAVNMEAGNEQTLGRGYSCGVSNVGVVDFAVPVSSDPQVASEFPEFVSTVVSKAYYGTSHSRNGVLCQLSCMSISATGELCGCLQFTDPLTSQVEADRIRNQLLSLISKLSHRREAPLD